jgi:hypothetical protein
MGGEECLFVEQYNVMLQNIKRFMISILPWMISVADDAGPSAGEIFCS